MDSDFCFDIFKLLSDPSVGSAVAEGWIKAIVKKPGRFPVLGSTRPN
jgi:hypothetical protein